MGRGHLESASIHLALPGPRSAGVGCRAHTPGRSLCVWCTWGWRCREAWVLQLEAPRTGPHQVCASNLSSRWEHQVQRAFSDQRFALTFINMRLFSCLHPRNAWASPTVQTNLTGFCLGTKLYERPVCSDLTQIKMSFLVPFSLFKDGRLRTGSVTAPSGWSSQIWENKLAVIFIYFP